MITSRAWTGKRYAVLGLARSGLATVAALIASGAEVVAWDEREEARAALSPLPLAGGAGGEPVRDPPTPDPSRRREGKLRFADPLTLDLTGFAGVVVSPGVPLNRHPIAAHAAKFGVPVIGDIELFAQARAELPPHKVVGITGTNGKSTTTALVHHMLKTAGVPTTMGGNIGLPILAQEPLPADGVYVLELSSYQIDLTFSLDCDVAVLLNVTPDHLDRYASFEGYRAAKLRLFEMQSRWGMAVGPEDLLREDDNRIIADICPIGGGWTEGIVRAWKHDQLWPSLQGPHNDENAAAAICVCNALDVDQRGMAEGLRTFPGLPHRMERVGTRGGVAFINDSKATNADAAAPALAAFSAVRWILGGRAKTAELDACLPHLGHVRSAYTIGEAGPMLARLLRSKLPVTEAGTLDAAIKAAAVDAQPGDVVLLSPACASFDQFRDFEDRGDQFRAVVRDLMA